MIALQNKAAQDLAFDKRQQTRVQSPLFLAQLDPHKVVEGVRLDDGYFAENFRTFGAMRETCPECSDVHLQLVLKQANVRLAHLFCQCCTRCFDVCYPDGSSALALA